MSDKRATLSLGKRSNKSKKPRSNVVYKSAQGYVDPNLANIYAKDPVAPRRMSDTIIEDEEFPSVAYGINGEEEEAYRGATQGDLQLGRIQHLSDSVQRGIQILAQGGSISGINSIDAAAAVAEFGEQIQGDPALWANQLHVDDSVSTPRSEQDKKMILSVLQNTSGEYFDKGPGSSLAGHTLLPERQEKANDDLATALSYIDELAGMYIDPRSEGHSIYGVKKGLLKDSLTKRFLDGTFSDESTAILPLPNETGVTGIRPTASYSGFLGTSFDRVGFDIYAEKNGLTAEDGQAFWEQKPNLKGSLFPTEVSKGTSSVDKAKAGRDQNFNYDQAMYKARFARKILREQMPTHRDESAGQIRMSGWDTPYGEQADKMNLVNESAIQGLDFQQASLELGESEYSREMAFKVGKGSDREGAYGMGPLSEVDVFIEKEQEKEVEQDPIEGIRQHTPEWHKARKGIVTASKLTNSSGRRLSEKELAAELAADRLGLNKFVGNAHTREGQEGEKLALQAFLNMQKKSGEPLEHTEVGLILNEQYQGFGASPDGRLSSTDEKGNKVNEGLLELKYLTSGSMDKALDKYRPQMQLQMAITGESKTHFFALDKYTGESIHEVVEADPELQEEIIRVGLGAIGLEKDVKDARGVQNLVKQSLEDRKAGRKSSAVPTDTSGQTSSFTVTEDIPKPMTGFRTKGDNVGDEMVRKYETKVSEEHEAISKAWAESDPAASFIKAEAAAKSKKTSDDEEASKAAKKATQQISELGDAAKKAASIMGELGGLITGGNKSGMDEERLAGSVGLDVAKVRGMREALVRGGVSEGATTSAISSAGSLVTTYSDEANASKAFTEMQMARGKSNLPEVRGLTLPSLAESKAMDAQEWMASATNAINSVASKEAKTQIAEMYGLGSELAAFQNVDGVSVMDVDERIDGVALRESLQGIQTIEQAKREVLEAAGSLGEASGVVGAGAGVVGGVVGSATAGWLAKSILGKSTPSAVSTASKGIASVAGKIGPGIAMTAVPMAARYVGNVKDDGGLADSGLDVLEFAAYGAAIGSVVPIVGTAVGASVGAGIGLVNEAYEYFTAEDDTIPTTRIGPMRGESLQTSSKPVINNIEVNTVVNKDSISTEVTENGDRIYLDENNNSTGFGR